LRDFYEREREREREPLLNSHSFRDLLVRYNSLIYLIRNTQSVKQLALVNVYIEQ